MSQSSQSQASSPAERRYLPRWEVNNRVSYQIKGPYEELREGQTRDLNCSGTAIVVGQDPTIYKNIKLTIYLDQAIPIEAQGEIMWIQNFSGKYLLGIRFIQIDESSQELILDHAFKIDKSKFVDHFFKGLNNPPE